ncbi:MAG: hypothetical protein WJ306_05145 [Ferrovum myxofaciens]
MLIDASSACVTQPSLIMIMGPMVIGFRKRRQATVCSVSDPPKDWQSDSGNAAGSGSGMKRPRASRQNEVEGNVLRQNERQRCKVRRDTPVLADTLENQAWMRPRQQEARTTHQANIHLASKKPHGLTGYFGVGTGNNRN